MAISRIIIIVLLAVALFAAEAVKVTGTVQVAVRDTDGDITEVVIAVIDDEHYEYYFVRNKGRGRDLVRRVGETVTVEGKAWRDYHGDAVVTYIYVHNCTLKGIGK